MECQSDDEDSEEEDENDEDDVSLEEGDDDGDDQDSEDDDSDGEDDDDDDDKDKSGKIHCWYKLMPIYILIHNVLQPSCTPLSSVAQKKTVRKDLPSDVKEGRTVFIRCVILLNAQTCSVRLCFSSHIITLYCLGLSKC